MSEGAGMAAEAVGADLNAIPEIGVGLVGTGFMCQAHVNAYRTLPYMAYPPPARPRLRGVAGRLGPDAEAAARRYGFERAHADWRELLADPAVQLVDNCGPNNIHAEVNIAALDAGKHMLSEKPLGRNAAESRRMLEAARNAPGKHMVAFNYRFVPAVRKARLLLEQGALGRIYHFRARYLPGLAGGSGASAGVAACRRRCPAAACWAIWVRTSWTWRGSSSGSRPW